MLIPPVSAVGQQFIGSGVECWVYEWADIDGMSYVLKTFKDEYEAGVAYEMQRDAAQHPDLAPQVHEGFGVEQVWVPGTDTGYKWDGPTTRWGYLSERVNVDHGCYINQWGEESDQEWYDLVERLEGYGFPTTDLHGGNVGLNNEGAMVRIDFGGAST